MSDTLHLAACIVRIEPHCVETTLPGGRVVLGMPHSSPQYRRTARDHGYGDDVARMNRCHEATHSLLAHVMGLPACPVFERVANGLHEATPVTRAAEAAILALESYANIINVDLLAVARRWGGTCGVDYGLEATEKAVQAGVSAGRSPTAGGTRSLPCSANPGATK